MSDRFAQFTGWELQSLARGVSVVASPHMSKEQLEAQATLMDEIHEEFSIREDQQFSDPEVVRAL